MDRSGLMNICKFDPESEGCISNWKFPEDGMCIKTHISRERGKEGKTETGKEKEETDATAAANGGRSAGRLEKINLILVY